METMDLDIADLTKALTNLASEMKKNGNLGLPLRDLPVRAAMDPFPHWKASTDS